MINLHESMGPDEQSALDLHCLFKRLHNNPIDDKNIRLCCNIRFKGVYMWVQCINGQDFHEMHADLRGSSNF